VSSKKNYFYILIPLASFFYFLSTPPLSITPFYFLSFTMIFYLYLGKESFNLKLLFIFFFLNYFFSLSWISQSFQTGGALYIVLGILMIFLLSSFLALLNILFIGLFNKIVLKRNIRIILIPLSLTLVAMIKEFLLGGFPWNPSSIIWVNNLYILKIVQLIGIYGFGIINHLLIALFLYGLFNKQKIILLSCSLLILVVYSLQFIPSNKDRFYDKDGEPISILIIQPNIKESLVNFSTIKKIEIYEKQTKEALREYPNSDLIIWPEGALNLDLNNKKALLKRIGNLLSNNQNLILGANALTNDKLYNRMYYINNKGDVEQSYDKQKLVLFGEYMPFDGYKISKFLDMGLSFSMGKKNNHMNLNKNFIVSPMICFESIFDYSGINNKICKTDFILQISNDSWFGNYMGPSQHFKNSLLRSVEQKMTLVRSTPSGISAVVNTDGQILDKIDNNKKGHMNFNIFKSSNKQECKPFLNIAIILILLMYMLGILYDRIRR